jgi:hypothetical protein
MVAAVSLFPDTSALPADNDDRLICNSIDGYNQFEIKVASAAVLQFAFSD